jgi:hypothetical protein
MRTPLRVLSTVIARLDRWAGRFNKWFGATGVAAGVEHSGSAGGPPTIDPLSVSVVSGQIGEAVESETGEPQEPDR